MGMERIKAKFPNGVLRTQHPYYMAEAIRAVPGCLSACLADPVVEPARQALSSFPAERIFMVGCGTSYNACQAVATYCRAMLGIPPTPSTPMIFIPTCLPRWTQKPW